MYVKFNLLVICAVLLNFGECNKCEDVYKCVSDWIADALQMSPSTNFTVDTIEEVPTKTQESDDSILTDLTRFLKDKFSNLFQQGRLLEVVGNKTKIYVQTFKINDSVFDSIPSIRVTTVRPDSIRNDISDINNHKQNNIFKLQYFNYDELETVTEKKSTTPVNWFKDFFDIKNQYIASIGNESEVAATTDKPDAIEKFYGTNTHDESYSTEFQYLSNTAVKIANEITTTPFNFNTELIPEIKSKNNAAIQNATIIEISTMKSNEKNNINETNTHIEANNKELENDTYIAVSVDEISKSTLSASLNSNHYPPTTPKINDKYPLGSTDTKEPEIVPYITISIDSTSKTTTLAYYNSNDNSQITPIIKDKHPIQGVEDTQGNEISFDDDVENIFHDSDNEIVGLSPDNLTDYLDIDYVDIYKDTTNEDVEYTPIIYTTSSTEAVKFLVNKKPEDGIESVYPWIATLFVMNADYKQFEYICDGILVSERVVLTAARCVVKSNATVDTNSILVILGKRSLQAMGPNELVLRVKAIKIHENFIPTEGKVDNDLAVIILDERVSFNVDIQPAPLGVKDTYEPLAIATTGWHVTGPLQPLYLRLQTTKRCTREADSNNIACFTLGDDETTCPSYGGLLVDRQDDYKWRVKGIATGNPVNGGVCFIKDLAFTRIGNYLEWIMKSIKEANI